MPKIWFFPPVLFLCFVLTVVKGQESVQLFGLHDLTPVVSEASLAVSVPGKHLKEVSDSVLGAESFVRSHVLAHYPSTNISAIVVGHALPCSADQENKLGLVLPSIKNIYYSLTRWGLHKEIKVSASFSSDCLQAQYGRYIKPILNFMEEIESPYVVSSPSHMPSMPDDTQSLVTSHLESMENVVGVTFNPNKIKVLVTIPKGPKPTSRKLSYIDPFPARPTPLAEEPTGSSVPAYAAKGPLPPLVGYVAPPPLTLPFAPELPPMIDPASPPYGPHLPPCNPTPSGIAAPVAAAPVAGVHNGLWCVAKPSVPGETLQEALDFACGEGGADCEAIGPHGSCYYPDSVTAHASYAFNSYWQKTKNNGGTCGFGGTAMLITSDPSFNHCRFVLA